VFGTELGHVASVVRLQLFSADPTAHVGAGRSSHAWAWRQRSARDLVHKASNEMPKAFRDWGLLNVATSEFLISASPSGEAGFLALDQEDPDFSGRGHAA